MELQGTIKKIGEIQTFGSGFQKREMILVTQEQYPQPINIEFTQDKIALLDNLGEGDQVKVGINIRGREWTSPQGEVKYFNSINGWRVERMGGNMQEPTSASQVATSSTTPAPTNDSNVFDEEDDLPF